VELAADEADRRGRPMLLVHAGVGAAEEEIREAQALLDEAERAALAAHPRLTVVSHVQAGADAATGLVDASKDAAMVVVGSRGRGGFAGLLLGSISQALVHHAHCPVLVVPPHGSRSAGPAHG
jgi:nucleotide-binding universal stress UspA family protein